ncbi:hypothetical protein RI054_43g150920 [Pseudoscourfieldia marina]
MVQARHRSCTAVELVAINGNQVVTANQKDVAVAFGREWLDPRVMVAVRAHELFLGKPFDANDAERARALARATLTTQVPWLPCEVLLTLASLDVMIKSHDTSAKEDGTTCLWEGRNLHVMHETSIREEWIVDQLAHSANPAIRNLRGTSHGTKSAPTTVAKSASTFVAELSNAKDGFARLALDEILFHICKDGTDTTTALNTVVSCVAAYMLRHKNAPTFMPSFPKTAHRSRYRFAPCFYNVVEHWNSEIVVSNFLSIKKRMDGHIGGLLHIFAGDGGDSDLSDYEVKAAWIAFLEQKAVKKVLGVVQDGNMKDLQKQLKENEDASQ